MRELSHLHSRDATYAIFCHGPYAESVRYRDFMGLEVPWCSAQDSGKALLGERHANRFFLVSYLRDGDRVFGRRALSRILRRPHRRSVNARVAVTGGSGADVNVPLAVRRRRLARRSALRPAAVSLMDTVPRPAAA